jgi:hypothetical protein
MSVCPPHSVNQNALGINIYLQGANRIDRSTWKNYRYETYKIQDRTWINKSCKDAVSDLSATCMYFMPISQDELNRNALLKQNPGWH